MQRRHILPVLFFISLLLQTACNTPPEEAASTTASRPGLPLPDGFDIRVKGTVENGQVQLDIEVDIPEGSYMISAMSDREYLGKFQLNWTDSTVVPTNALVEEPVSMPGWEPWDKVYTPMLFEATTLRQAWTLPSTLDTAIGEVFFVLEPQCVPYAVDFEVIPANGSITSGMVHPHYPE